MNSLFLEPFGGLAGDMLLAALLDLGRAEFGLEDLRGFAARLVPGACRLTVRRVRRGALTASCLEVITGESAAPPERHLAELLEILARAPLSPRARSQAAAALTRLAEVESRIHGCTPEEVHFHEIGAVDTLIDVAGACFALERLGIERVFCTPPYVGGGTVEGAHGTMPVPAPATAALLAGRPLLRGPGGERLTPTAAALLAVLTEDFEPPVLFTSAAEGYGAGSRDPATGPANVVRAALGREGDQSRPSAEAWQLDFNLDDATGEEVGFLLQELRAAGALESWSSSVQMKKDRPGVIVSALARGSERAALEDVAFRASPTLGVRWTELQRRECAREEILVELEGQPVRVKIRRVPARATLDPGLDLSPEYDDLAALARASGKSLRELESRARALALARLGGA